MKLKLFDINRAQPALNKLLTRELPVRVAFQISRLGKAVQDVYETIEEQRTNLVKKYGAATDDGFRVKDENITNERCYFAVGRKR